MSIDACCPYHFAPIIYNMSFIFCNCTIFSAKSWSLAISNISLSAGDTVRTMIQGGADSSSSSRAMFYTQSPLGFYSLSNMIESRSNRNS